MSDGEKRQTADDMITECIEQLEGLRARVNKLEQHRFYLGAVGLALAVRVIKIFDGAMIELVDGYRRVNLRFQQSKYRWPLLCPVSCYRRRLSMARHQRRIHGTSRLSARHRSIAAGCSGSLV